MLDLDAGKEEQNIPEITIDHPVVNPDDPAIEIMRKKAWQLTRIEWQPLVDMPNKVGFYTAGKKYVGLPYSSVKEIDKYVGIEVSFHTFMTAVHNPRSAIYTENISLPPYHGENCATYYGTVCSTALCYAIGLEIPYQANMLIRLPSFAKVVPQTMDALCVGDMLWRSGHCVLVTHIEGEEVGSRRFEVLESVGLGTYLRDYSEAEMQKVWQDNNYVLYRYLDLAKNTFYEPIPFVSDEGKAEPSFSYNDLICQQRGDRVSYHEGETVRLDISDLSWPTVVLYRDGELFREIPSAESVHLNDLPMGQYAAVLSSEEQESDPTTFEVIQTDVRVVKNRAAYRVMFSSDNAVPEYLVICSENGTRSAILTISPEQAEQGVRNFQTDGSGKYLKIFFKGNYGRVSNAPIPL